MTKRALFGLTLLGLLTYRGPAVTAQEPPRQHHVVDVEGELRVQRGGRSEFVPAYPGDALADSDRLRLQASSRATVACANLESRDVAPGVDRQPCPPEGAVGTGDPLLSRTRGGGSGAFPTIVSPRKTNLLNPRPTLRWTPVPAATGYTVSLRGADLSWRRQVGPRTELAYPEDEPGLKVGQDYRLTVVAGSRSSAEEGMPDLGFTLLSDEGAEEVRTQELKVNGLKLSDPMTDFMVAKLYASDSYGLYAEAIERVEAVAPGTEEPRVLQFLGDLYVRVALNRPAEERYLAALELALARGDVEGEAAAQDQLGKVYDALGNAGEAAERSGRALEIYRSLGDGRKVAEIEDRLTGVSRP